VIPDEAGYETVAGFILAELGRVAEAGDVVVVPAGTLTVERMDGRRIDRLQFRPAPGVDADDAGATGAGRASDASPTDGSDRAVVPEHRTVTGDTRPHRGERPALAGSTAVGKDDR
jgi:hypothetical protein